MFDKIILGWCFVPGALGRWYANQHNWVAVILTPVWPAFIMLWFVSMCALIAISIVGEIVYAIFQGVLAIGSKFKEYVGEISDIVLMARDGFMEEESDLEEESEETDEELVNIPDDECVEEFDESLDESEEES